MGTGIVVILTLLVVAGCTRGERAAPTGTTTPAVTQASPLGSESDQASAAEGPTRGVWVAVEDAGMLALVDLDRRVVVEQRRTGDGPHNLTVAPDGTVAVALYGSTKVAVLRAGEVAAVELGGRPHDVKPGDGRFVIANEAARRVEIVATDGRIGARIDLRAEPHDLDLTPDGRRAWVTLNGTDELALVDLDAAVVVRYVPTGQGPHDIRIAPDGGIWITDWDGPLHALTADGELLETIPLGIEAHHLAFAPDGSELWVVDHATRKAYVVDAASRKVVAELPLPGAPHHVAITPDGVLAAVADHTNGSVVVFDVARREHLATVAVGPGPHGVWALPLPG